MERNLRKHLVGVVVSDKMDKTIVVAVRDSVQHPLYKKILKRTGVVGHFEISLHLNHLSGPPFKVPG